MKKEKIISLAIKVLTVLIAATILVCIGLSYNATWYEYFGGKQKEAFRGVYGGGGKNNNGVWVSWDSLTSTYPHLHKIFIWTFIMLVVAIVFQIFFFMLTMLIVLTSCMPLKLKLALRFTGKKVKKILAIIAGIVLALLGFATFFFMIEHPKALSKDQGGICVAGCQHFSGGDYGPSTGWKLILACFILGIIQLIIAAIMGVKLVNKAARGTYQRIK